MKFLLRKDLLAEDIMDSYMYISSLITFLSFIKETPQLQAVRIAVPVVHVSNYALLVETSFVCLAYGHCRSVDTHDSAA
jgi:hypothetical protein